MSPRLPIAQPPAVQVEFQLVVWTSAASGWRARVVGPDAIEREFSSPFELARFVAWPNAAVPVPAVPAAPHGGLR